MFICTELIEETGRPPGLIFGMWGYFWPGSDKFESWKNFHTFDGVMTRGEASLNFSGGGGGGGGL